MLELDITDYLIEAEHDMISANQLQLGRDAAKITWTNAKNQAESVNFLNTLEECDIARDWLFDFGAWSNEELNSMSDNEIRALVLQFISGDINEALNLAYGDGLGDIDWSEYDKLSQDGIVPAYMFMSADGRVYYTLG